MSALAIARKQERQVLSMTIFARRTTIARIEVDNCQIAPHILFNEKV
jgi:hypothetical protein